MIAKEALARALHQEDCRIADQDRASEGLPPVQKWADPWIPSGVNQLNALLGRSAALAQDLRELGFAIVPTDDRMADALRLEFGGGFGSLWENVNPWEQRRWIKRAAGLLDRLGVPPCPLCDGYGETCDDRAGWQLLCKCRGEERG